MNTHHSIAACGTLFLTLLLCSCQGEIGDPGGGRRDGPSSGGPEAAAALPADYPLPATPDEAIVHLATAMQAGDLDRIVWLYAEPWGPARQRMLAAVRQAVQAEDKIRAAIVARFGGAASGDAIPEDLRIAPVLEGMRRREQRLASMDVIDRVPEGEAWLLRVKVSDRQDDAGTPVAVTHEWRAVPDGGGWKLLPASPDGGEDAARRNLQQLDALATEFRGLAAAYGRIADQVAAAEHASPAAVHQAMQRAAPASLTAARLKYRAAADAAQAEQLGPADQPVLSSRLREAVDEALSEVELDARPHDLLQILDVPVDVERRLASPERVDVPAIADADREGSSGLAELALPALVDDHLPTADEARRKTLDGALEFYRDAAERGTGARAEAERLKDRVDQVAAQVRQTVPAAAAGQPAEIDDRRLAAQVVLAQQRAAAAKSQYDRLGRLHSSGAAREDDLHKAQLDLLGADGRAKTLGGIHKQLVRVRLLEAAAKSGGVGATETQAELAKARADLGAAVRDAEKAGVRVPRAAATEAADPLAAILGQTEQSAEVRTFRAARPEPEVSKFSDSTYWFWKAEGLAVRFDQAGTITTLFFYAGGRDGYQRYKGELPAGLAFTDTRTDVERKLGQPKSLVAGKYITVRGTYDKDVTVEYDTTDAKYMQAAIATVSVVKR
jgi:hypothetical protein